MIIFCGWQSSSCLCIQTGDQCIRDVAQQVVTSTIHKPNKGIKRRMQGKIICVEFQSRSVTHRGRPRCVCVSMYTTSHKHLSTISLLAANLMQQGLVVCKIYVYCIRGPVSCKLFFPRSLLLVASDCPAHPIIQTNNVKVCLISTYSTAKRPKPRFYPLLKLLPYSAE